MTLLGGGKLLIYPFLFLFPCVSYCSEALASFLGRGKKSCVRSAGVCHFADINALAHKHSSGVCACRNLCTIGNPADQSVVSLTQEYKIQKTHGDIRSIELRCPQMGICVGSALLVLVCFC